MPKTYLATIAIALLIVISNPSHAQCDRLVNELFTALDAGRTVEVAYAKVNLRGGGAYSLMNAHNATATKGGTNYLDARFGTVFEDDLNRRDDTTLRIFRDGEVQIILHTWGNTVIKGQDVRCLSGRYKLIPCAVINEPF